MEPSILWPQPIMILNKIELLSRSEKKSLYSIVKGIQLLSYIREKNSDPWLLELSEYFSQANNNPQIWRNFGSILTQDSLRELAFICIAEEAFTFRTLSVKINQTQPTLYRNIKILTELGIVSPSLPLNVPHERGRRVVVFQTPDASPERITQTCQLHKKLKSPIYTQAIKATQIILDEYPSSFTHKEITKNDVLDLMRQSSINNRPQIIDMVTQQLTESGIRVWR